MADKSTTRKRISMAPGQRYGRLVAVNFYSLDRYGKAIWQFQCDCGKLKTALIGNVARGATRSCGCLISDAADRRRIPVTHGKTKSPEYFSWRSMLARCLNPKATGFSRYGGRGITICEGWRTFEGFYADMGPRPLGTTLDRLNPNGNYEPSNVRWATRLQQARTRTDNVMVEIDGKMVILKDYAKTLGLSYWGLHNRMRLAGESPTQAAQHLLSVKRRPPSKTSQPS